MRGVAVVAVGAGGTGAAHADILSRMPGSSVRKPACRA